MNTKLLQALYLGSSVLGLVLTWWHNLAWITDGEGSKSFLAFWEAGFVNQVTSSLTLDLLVVGAVSLVFVVAEVRRLKMSAWWPVAYLAISGGVALAFMFPLFLFFRERRLHQSEDASTP